MRSSAKNKEKGFWDSSALQCCVWTWQGHSVSNNSNNILCTQLGGWVLLPNQNVHLGIDIFGNGKRTREEPCKCNCLRLLPPLQSVGKMRTRFDSSLAKLSAWGDKFDRVYETVERNRIYRAYVVCNALWAFSVYVSARNMDLQVKEYVKAELKVVNGRLLDVEARLQDGEGKTATQIENAVSAAVEKAMRAAVEKQNSERYAVENAFRRKPHQGLLIHGFHNAF